MNKLVESDLGRIEDDFRNVALPLMKKHPKIFRYRISSNLSDTFLGNFPCSPRTFWCFKMFKISIHCLEKLSQAMLFYSLVCSRHLED